MHWHFILGLLTCFSSNHFTSGEMTFTLPYCTPTISGLDDGPLFFSTCTERYPLSTFGFDEVVGSRREALVLLNMLHSLADCAAMRDEFNSIPKLVLHCKCLNWHLASIS